MDRGPYYVLLVISMAVPSGRVISSHTLVFVLSNFFHLSSDLIW